MRQITQTEALIIPRIRREPNLLKALSHDAIFVATCNAILLLGDVKLAHTSFHQSLLMSVNSKLDWNDNLAAIFEAKLVINRLSSSVLFYCFSRRG